MMRERLEKLLRDYVLPDYYRGEVILRVREGKVEFLSKLERLDFFTPLQEWRRLEDGRIIYRLNRRSKLGKTLHSLISEELGEGEELKLIV